MKILKRLSIFLATILVLVFSISSVTFAYNVPKNIRVGLEYKYKEVSSVPLKNEKIEIGYLDGDSFVSLGEENSNGGYNYTVYSSSYLLIDETYRDLEDAKDTEDKCIREGFKTAIYCDNNKFSVAVLDTTDSRDVENKTGYKVSKINGSPSVYIDGNKTDFIYKNGVYPVIKALDNGEIINLSDRSYRGLLEVGIYTSKGLLTAVNIVPLEEYLYGVLPSEMPASYEKEALKAQAVAARSYTLTRLSVHKDSGYEVCDGINCQVYIGYGNESAVTNSVVDETRGQIAYYNNMPINAVYCASSGGETEDSENVWTNKVEYLRGVTDIYDPKETWTRTFTSTDIETILSSKGVNIGKVTDINITQKTELGRVIEIEIIGTNGSKKYSNDSVRSFFRLGNNSILSKNFTITKSGGTGVQTTVVGNYVTNSDVVNAPTAYVEGLGNIKVYATDNYVIGQNEPLYNEKDGKVFVLGNEPTTQTTGGSYTTFTINGKGNGHGVGMSQKGANGMAKQGFDYQEILKFYYTGIDIY